MEKKKLVVLVAAVNRQMEFSRRGAAAAAHATAGMARILSPNKKAYDRKRDKRVVFD